jgi:small-conductance mechanosensitive channel
MSSWIDILVSNTGSAWMTAGGILTVVVTVVIISRYAATRYLSAFVARTKTHLDDIVLVAVRTVSIPVVTLMAAYFAQKALVIPGQLTHVMGILAISAAFLQIALWGNAMISFFLNEATHRVAQTEVNLSARRAIALLSRLMLWSLVVILLLENLGVRLSPLLAGIGIGGVAVALAIQSTLSDLFCYIAIILDKPFIAGDFLVVDSLMGTVERIGLKTTRIRSLDGQLLIFANHDLINSRVHNYKTLHERRVVFGFGVTYETPLEKLKRIPAMVKSVFSSLQNVRLDRVHFAKLGDFSLNFEVVYFVRSGDYNLYMDVQQAVNLSLIDEFGKEDINFAYPTHSLYIQSNQPRNGRERHDYARSS